MRDGVPSDDQQGESGRQRGDRRRFLRRQLRALGRSGAAVRVGGAAIYGVLQAIRATQRVADGSSDWRAILTKEHPAIVALWHGQHLLAPFFRPRELPYVALLSRNVDAAINADVVERFGIGTVRGSGGRVRHAASEKGLSLIHI